MSYFGSYFGGGAGGAGGAVATALRASDGSIYGDCFDVIQGHVAPGQYPLDSVLNGLALWDTFEADVSPGILLEKIGGEVLEGGDFAQEEKIYVRVTALACTSREADLFMRAAINAWRCSWEISVVSVNSSEKDYSEAAGAKGLFATTQEVTLR